MTDSSVHSHGELLLALSNQIVAIYKEFFGKGPVKTRCWYLDDVVVCVLRGGLTRSEHMFVEVGRADRVSLQRESFHEAIAPVFAQAVEELTGRRVESVLDALDEDQDVATLTFLLESPEEVALNATTEGMLRQGEQMRRQAAEIRAKSRALREQHRRQREQARPGKPRPFQA